MPLSRICHVTSGIRGSSIYGVRCASNAANFPGNMVLARCGIMGGNGFVNSRVRLSATSEVVVRIPVFRYFNVILSVASTVARKTAVSPLPCFSPGSTLTYIGHRRVAAFGNIPAVFVTVVRRPSFTGASFSCVHINVVTNTGYPTSLVGHTAIRVGVHRVISICNRARTTPKYAVDHCCSGLAIHARAINDTFTGIRYGVMGPRANRSYRGNIGNRFITHKCGVVGNCCGVPGTATRTVSGSN